MTTHLCKHLNPTHPVFNQGKEREQREGIEGAQRGQGGIDLTLLSQCPLYALLKVYSDYEWIELKSGICFHGINGKKGYDIRNNWKSG